MKRKASMTLVVFVAVLAAVDLLVGDRTLWGEWIAVMPPVLWVLALSPAVVLLRSRLLALALLLVLIVTSEWPRFGQSGAAAAGTIRVVSWNIGSQSGGWAEAVVPFRPDLVLVQENVKPFMVPKGFHWYQSFDPGTLSRFPGQVLPSERVGPWTDPQLLLMEISGKKVLVANVRLVLPSVVLLLVDRELRAVPENYRLRIAQYDKLATLLKSTAERSGAEAILLGGDFNVPAHMPSLDPLPGFLQDAWPAAGSGWGATMPEFLPLVRIDQLWFSPEIQPVSVHVVRLAGSDHRAVVADMRLGGRTR